MILGREIPAFRLSAAMLLTAAASSLMTVAAHAGTAAPAPSHSITCSTYRLPVRQFATNLTLKSIEAKLCFRKRPTDDTPIQVLIHGGANSHTYWDTPCEPETYSSVQAATLRGYAMLGFKRLGYGASDHPPAKTLDFNVAGPVTHQLGHIPQGGGIGGFHLSRVILNGRSMGASKAENEEANYNDVDGLIVTGVGHCPFDPEGGPALIREGMRAVGEFGLLAEVRTKINSANACALLNIA